MTDHRNGNVSLSREEYDAFSSREESYQQLTVDYARVVNRNHDLGITCEAQARRLIESDQKIANLERVSGLQAQLVELLRGPTSVAKLEDLSEFWQKWHAHVEEEAKNRKLDRADALKYEPELFRTWKNWVNNAGKRDRFATAGTRQATEAAEPQSQRELQEHTIRRLREDNARLVARTNALEAELGPLAPLAPPATKSKL